ncbi:uncharacterized protein [Dermacentor albipictus]|uniref:uncharacterized protein isoform X2 n=1 Tax=Dermacentor albipictus TaxID=60249 RepID=UPI0038FC82F3
MDEENRPGREECYPRGAESEVLRHQSTYSLRAPSVAAGGGRLRCRRLWPLGVFMPLFLMPLFFFGAKYGGCLYCLLLPLILCAFSVVPKPATALVHLVTVPLLGLLEPELIAGQYLALEVLTVAVLLFVVAVLDAWSELVRNTAQLLCARWGLRRGPLFAGACACSFAIAWLLSGAVASVVVLYFVDRVLYTIRKEKMDQPPDGLLAAIPFTSQQDSSGSLRSAPVVEDETLFDRLAQVVLTMKKPERRKARVRKLGAAKGIPVTPVTPATTQASGSIIPAEPAGPECTDGSSPGKDDRKDDRKDGRFGSWPLKWFKKQGATDAQENLQEVTSHIPASEDADKPTNQQDDTGEARPTQARPLPPKSDGTLNLILRKVLRMREPEREGKGHDLLQRSPEASAVSQFGVSQPFAPGSSRAGGSGHSVMDTTATRQVSRRKSRAFNVFFWRENQQPHNTPNTKETEGTSTSTTEGKPRPAWYRRMSVFAGKLIGRRLSLAPSNLAQNARDAPTHHGTGPVASDEEQTEARGSGLTEGPVSESPSRLPRGHRSENFGNAESEFFGHSTPPLPPAARDDAATVATATVDAASQKPELSFQSSTSATLTKTPTPLVPVVESSDLEVAPANKGQVSSSSTMTFDSRSSDQRPVTTKLVKVTSTRACTVSPREPELSSQIHTPAAITDTETLVTPSIQKFRPGTQAKPASSAAAYLTPTITDTHTSDSKPVPPEPDRVGGPNLERHTDGPTSDRVTSVDEKPHCDVGKDAHGQVYNSFGQRIVEGNCLRPAPGLSEVAPAKRTGKDAQRGKKGRQKTHTGKDKIRGTKKRKRSAKRRADSTSSKLSCGDSTLSKGGTPASDQPSEAAAGSPNEMTELTNATEDLNAAPRSASEGGRHQEAIGFEAIPFLKEGIKSSAAMSQPAVPPNAGQLTGAEGAHDTRRTSADDEQARKTSSSGQPQSSEPEVNATAAASESKLEREQDDDANVKEPSEKPRTSKPSPKRARRSSDRNKAGKDRAHRETKMATKLGSGQAVCPESVANGKDEQPAANPVDALKTSVTSIVPATQTGLLAASGFASEVPTEDVFTPVEQTKASTASDIRAPTPRFISGNSRARFRLQEKRKQSVVSFEAGVKEPQTNDKVPLVKRQSTALAHLEELGPRLAHGRKSLPTILKTSATPTRLARRPSSVDFGPGKYTLISPLHTTTGSRGPSGPSKFSVGSMSSCGESSGWHRGRRPTAPSRAMGSRSHWFDDTLYTRSGVSARQSMTASHIGSQFGTETKKKTRSGRVDVHNAFILGPSLMSVLGNICSYHTGGNNQALRGVSLTSRAAQRSVSGVTWSIVTLPGVLLALVTCSAVIWLVYVRPHDPEPYSSENLAVKRAAREKRAYGQRRQRGVQFACAAYAAVFVATYLPSYLLNIDHRVALLSALTSMMLATSLVTSCLEAAFDFVRQIWQMVPWSILLFIGATQVSSKLLQVYDIPHEVFKLVSTSFWEDCTAVEAQVMLAIASSVMAETADKRVLVQVMAPVVVNIAEVQRVHPTYYAIPVIVGASSNVIMPASAPLALLHELARVSFWRLLLFGLLAKVIVLSMVIVMVNVADKYGILSAQTTPE